MAVLVLILILIHTYGYVDVPMYIYQSVTTSIQCSRAAAIYRANFSFNWHHAPTSLPPLAASRRQIDKFGARWPPRDQQHLI